MDITYSGGSSFLLKGSRAVAIDPEKPYPADAIVLPGRSLSKRIAIVNGPGEYEIGGVMITTVRGASGALQHAVTLDDITVLSAPEAAAGDEIGAPIDVALVRVEDVKAAQETIARVEPRVSVLYGPKAEELFAAMRLGDLKVQSRFSWNGNGAPPKAVVLKAAGAGRKAA